MSDYEWDPPRLPRPNDHRPVGAVRHRSSPVAVYASLEHPRESLAWVTGSVDPPRPRRASFGTTRTLGRGRRKAPEV